MWYQTSWFYAVCAATFVELLCAAYQLRLRQLAYPFNMRLEEGIGHAKVTQTMQGLLARGMAEGVSTRSAQYAGMAVPCCWTKPLYGIESLCNGRLQDNFAAQDRELADEQIMELYVDRADLSAEARDALGHHCRSAHRSGRPYARIRHRNPSGNLQPVDQRD